MSSDENSASEDNDITVIYQVEQESSGEEPPKSEWSSLEDDIVQENAKKLLHAEGLYSPGSGEVCTKYVSMSYSSVLRHPYFNYPPITDPGIEQALFIPEKPLIYSDDGQDLYLESCSEMDICPVRLFHRSLTSDEINLSYYGVNPTRVRAMTIALQYNKHVRRFDLTDNFLNDDACYHLNEMLRTNTTLDELVLTGCRIGASGAKNLMHGLYVNNTLKSLNLARNKIGDSGGVFIAKQIDEGSKIARMNLSNNQLGRQSATAFAEAFMFNNNLTNLDLSSNDFFHVPSLVKMLQELAGSKVLKELNLAWNSLGGDRVASAIGSILLTPSIMILDLSHNRIQGEALTLITSVLFKAKQLVTLDFSFNPFTPTDAYSVLQKMLRPRVKLTNLLMEEIWVMKPFVVLLNKVKNMKSRQNFYIKYGGVLENWTVSGPDPRDLLLRRAHYLGNLNKRHKVDAALYFLSLNKEYTAPVPLKEFVERLELDEIPWDENLAKEFTVIFSGPKGGKRAVQTVNFNLVCDYIHRMWPHKKLPPTPPPEEEEEIVPEIEQTQPDKKSKNKGKK